VKFSDRWMCKWCGCTFAGLVPNRALSHVAKVRIYGETGIKFCEATIPKEKLASYRHLASIKNKKKYDQINKDKASKLSLSNHTNNLAIQHLANDTLSTVSIPNDTLSTVSIPNNQEPLSDVTPVSLESNKSKFSQSTSSKLPKNQLQTVLDFQNNNYAAVLDKNKVDMAIADFVLSKGLSFRIVEDVKFQNMLNFARMSSSSYTPPSRKAVAGKMLNTIYAKYIKDSKDDLKMDDSKFGLSIMGDGATIKKKPLFNVLVSGVHCPIYVANVHDASDQLAQGQKKDAKYISNLCREVVENLDPLKNLFDLALFDGAANVQLAGSCLECFYPRISVIHGAEHVCSLFCSHLLNKTKIKKLVDIYRTIYKYFGSGCTHMVYAVFKDYAAKCNNNHQIGLVQAAGTRMGGYFYAFYRLLRLKKALKQTILSTAWANVAFPKKHIKKYVEDIINDENYFQMIKTVVLIMYPVIMCLRLADTNKPGMDKIWYYVRMATSRINCYAEEFDNALNGAVDVDLDVDSDYDVDDDSASEYSNEDVEEDMHCESSSFGETLKALWTTQVAKLQSDFAIAGWLLSVQEYVFEDAKTHTSDDILALQRVSFKLFSHLPNIERDTAVNRCMQQFTEFRNKRKTFSNSDWWGSEYTTNGESHYWHGTYSFINAPELAFVACRVTSKLLGIGNCERQWDQTKFCCTGKRSLISSEKLKKQCIIHGAHCLANAKKCREEEYKLYDKDFMSDDNLRKELDCFLNGKEYTATEEDSITSNKRVKISIDVFDMNRKPARIFNAYLEDWEKAILHKNEYKHECKLLAKYAGLRYIWPEDTPYACTISSHCLCFKEKEKSGTEKGKNRGDDDTGWGWCVILVPKGLEYHKELIQEYEHLLIESHNDEFQLLISATPQDDGVICINKEGNHVDPQKVFDANFSHVTGMVYKEYDDFPDSTSINCSALA
jgi:hypothetical protein